MRFFSCHQAKCGTCMYVAITSPRSLFYDKCVPKNALQSNENSEVVFQRPNFDNRRLSSRADVCFGRQRWRLFLLLPDSLYLACPTILYCFFIGAELRCNYMILNTITLEPYNSNSIPNSNFSTGTHNATT